MLLVYRDCFMSDFMDILAFYRICIITYIFLFTIVLPFILSIIMFIIYICID